MLRWENEEKEKKEGKKKEEGSRKIKRKMGRGGESKGHHYHPECLQDTPGTSSPRPQGANFHDVKGKFSRGLIMNTFEVFKFIFLNIDLCKGP